MPGRAGSGSRECPPRPSRSWSPATSPWPRLTGGRVHFLHLSSATSVELVRAAKARGLAVTAEAAPHHFTLTDSLCCGYDPLYKVNPPLRTDNDVKAVKEGLADGTIDAIATDHAPHPAQEKERPFDEAPPGMLGLETALALTLTELVVPGLLDLPKAIALAVLAAGPHRRAQPSTAARSPPDGPPTSPSSTPRPSGRSIPPSWPADPATRPTPAGS